MAARLTSPLAVLESGSLTAYWRFHRAVAAAQPQAWLPAGSGILLDISGPQASAAAQAAASGHAVVRVLPQLPALPEPPPPARPGRGRAGTRSPGRPGSPASSSPWWPTRPASASWRTRRWMA